MHGTCQTQSNNDVKDNTRKRTNEDTQSKREQNKAKNTNASPSSSPPRKKLEKDIDDSEETFDLDDEELNVEKELSNHFLLQKRIKELESQVALLLNEKKMLKITIICRRRYQNILIVSTKSFTKLFQMVPVWKTLLLYTFMRMREKERKLKEELIIMLLTIGTTTTSTKFPYLTRRLWELEPTHMM